MAFTAEVEQGSAYFMFVLTYGCDIKSYVEPSAPPYMKFGIASDKRLRNVTLEPFEFILDQPPSVLRLTAGEPDFDTPEPIKAAAKKAVDEGFNHYTAAPGLLELRQAVSEKLWRQNRVHYDPEEVLITPGSSLGIYLTMLSLVGEGDEIIVPDPSWLHYERMVEICGAEPVALSIGGERGQRVRWDALKQLITPATRVIIVNSPSNPTGMVLTREDLEVIARAAAEYDLTVLSDENYERIIYEGAEHVSIASLPGMAERTVVANGFSKAYAMTGWRVGYIAAPLSLAKRIASLSAYLVICTSSVSQKAACAALSDSSVEGHVEAMVQEFSQRRRLVIEGLAEMHGLNFEPPDGTFYAWVGIAGLGLTSDIFAKQLVEQVKLGVAPGHFFGTRGRSYVRLSFAYSRDNITDGLRRLKLFAQALSKERHWA